MKKLLSFALSIAFVLAAPSIASAKDKSEKKEGHGGKVTAVDTTASTITVQHGKKGEAQTLKVDASTKITVDGKDAKLGDITTDMVAKVSEGSTPGTAASIEAGMHEKKKKDK